MNKEVKPTWNYILNDLALYNLLMRVAYGKDVPKQDKVDLEHQIKLLQQENKQLQAKVNQLEKDYKNELEENLKLSELWRKSQEEKRQLEANRDEAIRYIKAESISFLNIAGQRTWCGKHSGDKILEILERGKE